MQYRSLPPALGALKSQSAALASALKLERRGSKLIIKALYLLFSPAHTLPSLFLELFQDLSQLQETWLAEGKLWSVYFKVSRRLMELLFRSGERGEIWGRGANMPQVTDLICSPINASVAKALGVSCIH